MLRCVPGARRPGGDAAVGAERAIRKRECEDEVSELMATGENYLLFVGLREDFGF